MIRGLSLSALPFPTSSGRGQGLESGFSHHCMANDLISYAYVMKSPISINTLNNRAWRGFGWIERIQVLGGDEPRDGMDVSGLFLPALCISPI